MKNINDFNMDFFSLKGKNAIVTGGVSGLGQAFALALAKAGANIFVFAAVDDDGTTKKLIEVAMDENDSVTHDVTGKHTGASVLLKKSPEGTGIIAGGPARNVCELAGIKNIRTKSLGSNNKQNVVLATINALSQLKSPEEVAKLRGKSVEEIVG